MPTLQRHTHLQVVSHSEEVFHWDRKGSVLPCHLFHRGGIDSHRTLCSGICGEHCGHKGHVVLLQKYTKTLRLCWRKREKPLSQEKKMSWRTSRGRWKNWQGKTDTGWACRNYCSRTTWVEFGEAWRPSQATEVQTIVGDQQRQVTLTPTSVNLNSFCQILPTNLTESFTPSSSDSNKLSLTWRGLGALSGVLFLDISHTFNNIRPELLRDKLKISGVDQHLTSWSNDHLTNCSPFLLTLYMCNMLQCNALGALLEDGLMEHGTIQYQRQWHAADAFSGYEHAHHQSSPVRLFRLKLFNRIFLWSFYRKE